MITVGTMQLHQPEAPDAMEPFFVGGEYHTDVSRLSSHDHSGGLLGAPVAVTIPDGSITAADLDPSVLAPYALTDGSKPFTGEVTMQADAVVRDALRFGQQGTGLAPDVSLSRTDPGLLSLAGDWHAPSAEWGVRTGAPPGTTRLRLSQAGTLSLTPDAGLPALSAAGALTSPGHLHLSSAAGFNIQVTTPGGGYFYPTADDGVINGHPTARWQTTHTIAVEAGASPLRLASASNVQVSAGGTFVHPAVDNSHYLGHPSFRFYGAYITAGVTTGSSAEAKQDITPLAPEAALAAVRATDPVTFSYTPPERGPEWYELPDDPEQAEQVLLQRLTAAPLEAGARHQAGVVLGSPDFNTDPLFQTGEGQTNAANTAGVLLAAIKALDTRLTALEGS